MSTKSATPVLVCRACRRPGLLPVLDLGRTPIANALAEPAAAASDALRFPLGVQLCASCSLVQVTHDLPAAVIFDGSYPYYSAYSSTVVARAERFARELVKARELDPRSLVMEIGSNDGYLLRHLRRAGIGVLGVDPAAGPGAAAAALGVPTVQDFFGEELAHALRRDHGQADVVVANNVLAHVPDINDFVAGIAEVLAPGGVVTIENPSVRTMVDQLAFDTIYHEHFSYLSTHAVERLFARHGLQLNHVDTLPEVHGGSLRWHLSRSPGRSAEARRVLADEAAVGVGEPRFYAGLEARVAQAQRNLRSFVADVRGKGLRIAAYGATAKGATLLNTTGLTSSDIEFVVDKNPAKQHKVIPGCGVPIRSPEALLQSRPDYALLLAWNLADEIIAEQRAYLAAGGRFVLPVTPDLTPAILKDSARP